MSYTITDEMWGGQTTILKKNKENKNIVKAQREGQTTSEIKNNCSVEVMKNIKLDNSTGECKHKTVGKEMGLKISKARCSKGLSQKQLANKINKTIQIINSYETGKAILDKQILSIINKELGIKK
tara:strand:+ start:86 stop:460 length:375 start_codon:yes stop_codon:yes gene_type:complete